MELLEKERKAVEASQLPVSGSTTSDTSAVEEVRQAIREELKQNLKILGINPELRDTSASSHSIIDLVTPSNISPALSQLWWPVETILPQTRLRPPATKIRAVHAACTIFVTQITWQPPVDRSYQSTEGGRNGGTHPKDTQHKAADASHRKRITVT